MRGAVGQVAPSLRPFVAPMCGSVARTPGFGGQVLVGGAVGQVAPAPAPSCGIGVRLRRVVGLCPVARVRGRSSGEGRGRAGCPVPAPFRGTDVRLRRPDPGVRGAGSGGGRGRAGCSRPRSFLRHRCAAPPCGGAPLQTPGCRGGAPGIGKGRGGERSVGHPRARARVPGLTPSRGRPAVRVSRSGAGVSPLGGGAARRHPHPAGWRPRTGRRARDGPAAAPRRKVARRVEPYRPPHRIRRRRPFVP